MSPESGVCIQCCMSVSAVLVHGCAVSRRYINVCNCGMFSVVNVYLDHLKICVVCINGQRYVCCSQCNVVSDECNEPTSSLDQSIGTHSGKVMYFWCFCFRSKLGFFNYDDICMCVVTKQFELLEFVFDSVYVDLPCICLWYISQIQTCFWVVVGPGFVSTPPACTRRSINHPTGPHGRLTIKSAPHCWGRRFRHNFLSSLPKLL